VKNALNIEDLLNIGEGRLADSVRINRELLASDVEDGSFVNAATSAGNLAFVLVWSGDLPAARSAARQAEALNRRANVRRAHAFMAQAMVEIAAGQLPLAQRLLTEGDKAAAQSGDRWNRRVPSLPPRRPAPRGG
jgi:ATP/maltotriose-dependent transcriptional regulator MalT